MLCRYVASNQHQVTHQKVAAFLLQPYLFCNTTCFDLHLAWHAYKHLSEPAHKFIAHLCC